MQKKNNFEFEPSSISKQTSSKTNIESLKKAVKTQYDTIELFQDDEITKENVEKLERIILSTEDIIENCMTDTDYYGNRDQYFINLIFICHKLSLRIETYKLENKVEQLDKKSTELLNKQSKLENQSNNLIYNILSFIVSFSIVSAAVEGIKEIKDTVNIILFMTFCVFIVITTLIGLNNFYKNNEDKKRLNDNYFLWKILLTIIILLGMVNGVKYIKDNPEQFKDLVNITIIRNS